MAAIADKIYKHSFLLRSPMDKEMCVKKCEN